MVIKRRHYFWSIHLCIILLFIWVKLKKYLQECEVEQLVSIENGLVWFYGLSTIVGYLMPNLFLYI